MSKRTLHPHRLPGRDTRPAHCIYASLPHGYCTLGHERIHVSSRVYPLLILLLPIPSLHQGVGSLPDYVCSTYRGSRTSSNDRMSYRSRGQCTTSVTANERARSPCQCLTHRSSRECTQHTNACYPEQPRGTSHHHASSSCSSLGPKTHNRRTHRQIHDASVPGSSHTGSCPHLTLVAFVHKVPRHAYCQSRDSKRSGFSKHRSSLSPSLEPLSGPSRSQRLLHGLPTVDLRCRQLSIRHDVWHDTRALPDTHVAELPDGLTRLVVHAFSRHRETSSKHHPRRQITPSTVPSG